MHNSDRLMNVLLTRLFALFVCCALCFGCVQEQHPVVLTEEEVDLGSFFGEINPEDATFVVWNAASNTMTRHNPTRAAARFIPASTYKIPNSLIALETGVIRGADHVIPWDTTARLSNGFWAEVWSQDHTLRTAIRHSVVWYYQEIAREVGAERMQQYVDTLDYGNKNIEGDIDLFWLTGELRISPNEQVAFLKRLYEGELPVSDATTQTVKDILVLEDTLGYRLSGKTGTANVTETRELLWLVGYVERDDNTWYYAFNMEGEEAWELFGNPQRRLDLVKSLLQEVGVIEGV